MTEKELERVDRARIANTLGKMDYHLSTHNSICVGVSGGGADSDVIVHMIATNFRQYLHKIKFVFADTGLEYKATREHLEYLENRYDIEIVRVKGVPIPTAVRKYGVPIVSKDYSNTVRLWINNNESSRKLRVEGQYLDKNGNKSRYNLSPKQREMAYAIKERGVSISDKCCAISKKKPAFDFYKKVGCDLTIAGERRAEGGQRATGHSDCFESAKSHKWDKYMPLFFWNDETKQYYKETQNIKYSDCYEVWGMKRTGCVGCPFNSKAGEDLFMTEKHEPKMVKACMNIFGESYRLMAEFNIRRKTNHENLVKWLEHWDSKQPE